MDTLSYLKIKCFTKNGAIVTVNKIGNKAETIFCFGGSNKYSKTSK